MNHQIYETQRQDYTEDEIVSNVIRSMLSGLRLKRILEMKSNIGVMSLGSNISCIKLREKPILTSKTSGEIEYDEVLVSRLLLRSMERGLEINLIL